MNFVDIGMLFIILLSMIIGYKRGVIKTTVKLVGLIIIAIISYQFKGPLAGLLIKYLPFFDFGGSTQGLFSLNILFYHALAFLFIFIMLYCILNILLAVAGLLDKLLKATIILYLPDKILGAVVGFVEGVIISFILIFVLCQLPFTQGHVMESKYAHNVLNRTPIIRVVLANTTKTVEGINSLVSQYKNEEDKQSHNIAILNELIKYRIITADEVQKLINKNKMHLPNVTFE